MTQYLVAIHHPNDYDPSVGPEAMSKIRIEDPLFSSIVFEERPKTGVRPAILAIRNYEIVLIRNRWRA